MIPPYPLFHVVRYAGSGTEKSSETVHTLLYSFGERLSTQISFFNCFLISHFLTAYVHVNKVMILTQRESPGNEYKQNMLYCAFHNHE